jgi:hypothetical protein
MTDVELIKYVYPDLAEITSHNGFVVIWEHRMTVENFEKYGNRMLG